MSADSHPRDVPETEAGTIQFGVDIGAYVLAERERCAKIAESKAEECVVQDDEWLACKEIAVAIRSGK